MLRGGPPAGARSGAAAAGAVVLAVLVGYPLVRLTLVAVGDRVGAGSAGMGAALRNPVVLAGAVTLAAVPVGVALALVLRRPDLPGRALWQAAVLFPVVVPDFVLGYSWTQAYARAGFTDTLVGVHWAGL